MCNTTLLCGYVGSHAYGMATPLSDHDQLGVYAIPTEDILGLGHTEFPTRKADGADHSEWEIKHFLELALQSNPAALEVLWLDTYNVVTIPALELIGMRSAFLSAEAVRSAYLGYAKSQFARMRLQAPASDTATISKRSKNARHLLRLLDQGLNLYMTGEIQLKVTEPQRYFDFGVRAVNDPEKAVRELSSAEEAFRLSHSPLPDSPDSARVGAWLRNFRLRMLREEFPVSRHWPE